MKKINFNKVATLVSAALLTASAFIATSCKDDAIESTNSSSSAGNTPSEYDGFHYDKDGDLVYDNPVKANVISLTYDRFLSANDVTVNADTTLMVINKAMLDEIKADINKPQTKLAVWRANNEHVFYANVASVKDKGTTYDVTITKAQLEEVLAAGDYHLNTKLYVDKGVPARTNGEINTGHYYNQSEDTYHPVAIIVTPSRTNSDQESTNISKLGTVSIENLEKSNIDFNTQASLDFNKEIKDKKLWEDKEAGGNVTLDKLNFNAKATFHLDLVTGVEEEKVAISTESVGDFFKSLWNKVKNKVVYVVKQVTVLRRFDAYVDANANANMEMTAAMKKKFEKKDSKQLCEFEPISYVFAIGPVPVEVEIKPAIVAAYSLETEGSFEAKLKASENMSLKAGAEYENGWNAIWEPNVDSPKIEPSFTCNATAKAKVGVLLKVPARVYSLAGPNIQFGPCLSATGKAGLNITSDGFAPSEDLLAKENVELLTKYYMYYKNMSETEARLELVKNYGACASVDFELGGKVGADIKIWKFELAKYEKDFTLWKKNLWKVGNDYEEELTKAKSCQEDIKKKEFEASFAKLRNAVIDVYPLINVTNPLSKELLKARYDNCLRMNTTSEYKDFLYAVKNSYPDAYNQVKAKYNL